MIFGLLFFLALCAIFWLFFTVVIMSCHHRSERKEWERKEDFMARRLDELRDERNALASNLRDLRGAICDGDEWKYS